MKTIFLILFTSIAFPMLLTNTYAEELPDLVINDVEYIVDYWRPDYSSFMIKICNIGSFSIEDVPDIDLENRVNIGYEDKNNKEIWSVDFPKIKSINLKPGKCVRYITTNTINLTTGQKYLLNFTIDSYVYQQSPGDIAESNEGNNNFDKEIYIPLSSELNKSRGYNFHLDEDVEGKCFFRFVRSQNKSPLPYYTLSECITSNSLPYPEGRYAFEDYNCADRLARTPTGYEDIACPAGEDIPLISKPDLEKDWYSSIFREYIDKLMSAGIVKGDSDGQFNPKQNITRAQFATIVFNAFGLEENLSGENFEDVPDSSPHKTHILTLKNLQIINGKSDNFFDHDGYITRGEATSIIVRVFNYLKINTNLENFAATFPDIEDSVHKDNILILSNINTFELEKIIKGYSTGEFKPDDFISREQSAKILYLSRQLYLNS